MTRELCERCGAPLYSEPVQRQFARLCPRHLQEANANAPVFACYWPPDADPLAESMQQELDEQQPPAPVARLDDRRKR
jgi:hypothetical protein